MHKITSAFFIFCSLLTASAQVVINELDVDSPSTDTMEFIELKSDAPEQSLDGYVLVLFNGSSSGNDSSYFALDLDGFTTNINGIYLIANNDVSPVGDFILFDNTIQNGADAVAIYQGNASDFPEGTRATTANLVDALAYDTNDADDTGLLGLLGLTEQINEGSNNGSSSDSIQRNNDGSYTVGTPTPGDLNDGSGVQFNGVAFTTSSSQYTEGEILEIIFTTETAVTDDLIFNLQLDNQGFTSLDYTGNKTVTLLEGNTEVTVTFDLVDDAEDEGDEVTKIVFGDLPNGFRRLNDNLEVRIVDNDFTVASWGSPLNPTYDQVESTQPNGYYDDIDGLAGDELRQALQDIIADPETVRAQTYTDVIDILKVADQNPENSNQVWLLYTEQPRPKLDFQSAGGSNTGLWNREHTYPGSRAGYFSIDLDDIADGPDVFVTTKADSLRHGNSDAHGLRATDGPENSSRGNQDYGEYDGPDGSLGSWHGDVARAVMFLSVRYNGIDLTSGNPDNSTEGLLGDLDLLLEWHRNDPPDDFEMNRNNIVYTWQFNRNPFIDQPDLAEFIWGTNVGDTYENPLSVDDNTLESVIMYPNPTSSDLKLQGISQPTTLTIYTMSGQRVFLQELTTVSAALSLQIESGIYIVELSNRLGKISKKLIIK